MFSTKSKQTEHVRFEDEISFDIVAETGNIVDKNGNSVETTFDFVQRIVRLVAFDNVASTLLLVWTGFNSPPQIGGDRRRRCIRFFFLFNQLSAFLRAGFFSKQRPDVSIATHAGSRTCKELGS